MPGGCRGCCYPALEQGLHRGDRPYSVKNSTVRMPGQALHSPACYNPINCSEGAKDGGCPLELGLWHFYIQNTVTFSVFCFNLWSFGGSKNNHFSIISLAFYISLPGGVMSEESVQSWLSFGYCCCMRMGTGIDTGWGGSSQGQAGAVQGGGRRLLFPASAPLRQGMWYPALPLKPQAFWLQKGREDKKKCS